VDIQTATIKAKEEGRGITRVSWGARSPLIIPTNTALGLLIADDKNRVFQGWQPTADEISADDWIVYG